MKKNKRLHTLLLLLLVTTEYQYIYNGSQIFDFEMPAFINKPVDGKIFNNK